jgi:hypothetical protein
MRGAKKQPRWVVPFLRALERTGDARASAADAGIDHTTAYARRRAHADFAAAWAGALRAHDRRVKLEEAEELEAFERNLPSFDQAGRLEDPSTASGGSPPHPADREELVASNGRMKRVGHDRWSRRKEKIFFDELAATNNIKRSAEAAGVSYNAVLARRLKHPLFRAKWEAVAQCAKAGIGMYVLEASQQTFDPDTIDVPSAMPRVTIAEAIRISESKPARGRSGELPPDPFAEEAASMTEDEVAEIKERIIRKLQRMRRRDRPELLAQGWSYDEEYDRDIPPGWVRGE